MILFIIIYIWSTLLLVFFSAFLLLTFCKIFVIFSVLLKLKRISKSLYWRLKSISSVNLLIIYKFPYYFILFIKTFNIYSFLLLILFICLVFSCFACIFSRTFCSNNRVALVFYIPIGTSVELLHYLIVIYIPFIYFDYYYYYEY